LSVAETIRFAARLSCVSPHNIESLELIIV
jgi:hypothetical protein